MTDEEEVLVKEFLLHHGETEDDDDFELTMTSSYGICSASRTPNQKPTTSTPCTSPQCGREGLKRGSRQGPPTKRYRSSNLMNQQHYRYRALSLA